MATTEPSAEPRVWFITGCSTGLGKQMAKAALARGDRVIATARNISHVEDLIALGAKAIQVDVTESFEVLKAIAKEAEAIWGKVDVVVNNAGFAGLGAIEELGGDGILEQFKVNFFGAINITNAFLPFMRARRDGTIVMLGSRSGWRTLPLTSAYASSKAAMNSLGETLATELAPFNVRVLTLVPGGFRTDGTTAFPSLTNASSALSSYNKFPDYEPLRAKMQSWLDKTNGKQLGSPDTFAEIVLDIVRGEGVAVGKPWPERLVMGSDSAIDIRGKMQSYEKGMVEWADVLKSTDIPKDV